MPALRGMPDARPTAKRGILNGAEARSMLPAFAAGCFLYLVSLARRREAAKVS